jgi:Beta-lactamase enzyme family
MGRWTLTGAVLAAALLLPASAGADWAADARRAASYASVRGGAVMFSLRAEGREYGMRQYQAVDTRSVVKAMYLVAYLRQRVVRRRALRRGERALLAPMIRWSDNGAASTVLGMIGTERVVAFARRARMRCFAPSLPYWGNSTTCAADQSRFFLRIERWLPRRHRGYALRLLASIVPSQRWGIASLRYPGWQLHFKGGWGSGSGASEHQVALLRGPGGERVALAIMTLGSPSAAYARETQRGVAARLLQRLRPRREVWRPKRRGVAPKG